MSKIQIKESEVIKMLSEGKTREEIGTYYELSKADTAALFKHPTFKNLKVHKTRPFQIIADVSAPAEETTKNVEVEDIEEVVETATEIAEVTNEVEEEVSEVSGEEIKETPQKIVDDRPSLWKD